MSACFVYSGRKFGTGVAVRDRRVRVRLLEREQHRERPADREPAPDDHDVPAFDRDVVVHEQRLDAERRARARSDRAHHEPAEVDRVQAVGVLGRIDRVQRGLVVEPFGSGSCTMNASTPGRR